MDSGGNIYASKVLAEALEQETGRPIRDLRQPEKMPKSIIAIESPEIARALASLNRKARIAFYARRRAGDDEETALWAAEATIDPGRPAK